MKGREPVGFLFENPDDPDRQPDPFRYDAASIIALIVLILGIGVAFALWLMHRG